MLAKFVVFMAGSVPSMDSEHDIVVVGVVIHERDCSLDDRCMKAANVSAPGWLARNSLDEMSDVVMNVLFDEIEMLLDGVWDAAWDDVVGSSLRRVLLGRELDLVGQPALELLRLGDQLPRALAGNGEDDFSVHDGHGRLLQLKGCP